MNSEDFDIIIIIHLKMDTKQTGLTFSSVCEEQLTF